MNTQSGKIWHDKTKISFRVRQRYKVKKELVELKGGKCAMCQGIFPPCCYDFHHLYPEEKPKEKFDILSSVHRGKTHIKNCILLCSNCHRIYHNKYKPEM